MGVDKGGEKMDYKEVYFYEYCETCRYKNTNDDEYPCDKCLSETVNLHSHKPVKYQKKKK